MRKQFIDFCKGEEGAASTSAMIMVAVSFIGLLVIIIMFPILITGIGTISALTLTNYTGLLSIVNLTPLLVWVGAVVMTVVTAYMAQKQIRGS